MEYRDKKEVYNYLISKGIPEKTLIEISDINKREKCFSIEDNIKLIKKYFYNLDKLMLFNLYIRSLNSEELLAPNKEYFCSLVIDNSDNRSSFFYKVADTIDEYGLFNLCKVYLHSDGFAIRLYRKDTDEYFEIGFSKDVFFYPILNDYRIQRYTNAGIEDIQDRINIFIKF